MTRWQRPLMGLGAALSLAGALYLTWAIVRYDPRVDPRKDPGFDRPVAQLAFLFERAQFVVDNAEGSTPGETRLLKRLSRNMQFSAGIMVLILRIFMGTLALVFGFAIMTVVVERARLLAIISRLRDIRFRE